MGKLIVIDGLDGSGKETQSKYLSDYLESKGKKVRLLSFPTYDEKGSCFVKLYLDGKFGNDPNDTNAYSASVFYAMDRFYSFRTDWEKDYKDENTVLIANRYTTANAVHQLSKLPESEWESFLTWLWDFEFSKIGLPHPDKVIYLEMPPEVSMKLIDSRSNDTGRVKDIHEKDANHLINSYKAAKYSAGKLGWISIKCCDEAGNLKSREEIHQSVKRSLGI